MKAPVTGNRRIVTYVAGRIREISPIRPKSEHLRGHARRLNPRGLHKHGRMRIFSYNSAARRCAPIESEPFPGYLRRWTDHSPTPRVRTESKEYRPTNLTAPTATPQEQSIKCHADSGARLASRDQTGDVQPLVSKQPFDPARTRTPAHLLKDSRPILGSELTPHRLGNHLPVPSAGWCLTNLRPKGRRARLHPGHRGSLYSNQFSPPRPTLVPESDRISVILAQRVTGYHIGGQNVSQPMAVAQANACRETSHIPGLGQPDRSPCHAGDSRVPGETGITEPTEGCAYRASQTDRNTSDLVRVAPALARLAHTSALPNGADPLPRSVIHPVSMGT